MFCVSLGGKLLWGILFGELDMSEVCWFMMFDEICEYVILYMFEILGW